MDLRWIVGKKRGQNGIYTSLISIDTTKERKCIPFIQIDTVDTANWQLTTHNSQLAMNISKELPTQMRIKKTFVFVLVTKIFVFSVNFLMLKYISSKMEMDDD